MLEDFILNDIKKESYPNLKKWLRYQLFQSQDADVILKKSDVILKLGWYKKEIKYKHRYLDCIFSMRTHLNMLLNLYNPKATKYAWFLIYFDEIFGQEKIKEFSEKSEVEPETFKKCFDEFERFAKNTHTLGNYMPVPDERYNKEKGFLNKWKYNDRIELFIQTLFNNTSSDNNKYRNWFNNDNINKLHLSGLFKNIEKKIMVDELSNLKLHTKVKFEADDIKEFSTYLEFVNKWIEARTSNLIKIINDK